MSEATHLSCMSKPIRRSRILETAEGCVGAPFRHQGRSKELGLDCLGLIILCAHEAGYTNVPDDRTYNIRVTGHDLRATLTKYCRKKPLAEAKPGDIFLMAMRDEIIPRHVGIFTGTHVIHATLRRRKVVKDLMVHAKDWICGVYEFPGVDDV